MLEARLATPVIAASPSDGGRGSASQTHQWPVEPEVLHRLHQGEQAHHEGEHPQRQVLDAVPPEPLAQEPDRASTPTPAKVVSHTGTPSAGPTK